MFPIIDGKASKLYKDLLAYTKDRKLTNYLYALYTATGVASTMDSNGFVRNSQKEHSFSDVKNFLKIDDYNANTKKSKIAAAERALGAIDSSNLRVEYANAYDALSRVKTFNETNKELVANVYQKNDKFVILVDKKNSSTFIWKNKVAQRLEKWEASVDALNAAGIDLTDASIFNPAFFNANMGNYIYEKLHNLAKTENKYLSRDDIALILNLNSSDSRVTRAVSMFGSIDDAANSLYDSFRNKSSYTTAQHVLISSLLTNLKSLPKIDFDAWMQKLDSIDNSYHISEDTAIKDFLSDLNKKYHLDKEEIHNVSTSIRTMTDAISQSIMLMEREQASLEREQGVTAESKKLNDIITRLGNAIISKKYYLSTVQTLGIALDRLNDINTVLEDAINFVGTTEEKHIKMAEALTLIQKYQAGYMGILKALANIENLVSEDNFTDSERQAIKDKANEILDYFRRNEQRLNDLKRDTISDIYINILGSELYNGTSVADLVEMSNADSSIMDFFYSTSRVSNPLVSSLSGILEDARNERDARLREISTRIREAHRKLREAGIKDTAFMYESNGHIISDINWDDYYSARRSFINYQNSLGVFGTELKIVLQNWEDLNSEDRVVDASNGRTERVPNNKFRKPFPSLTPAQREYYDTMMQIKGELGSMLPSYAQRHYSPPQVRMRTIANMKSHFKKGGVIGLVNFLKRLIKESWKIKEDDTAYSQNGIIVDGAEFSVAVGDIDNTAFRQIPIFYINKLKHQEDLNKNFSSVLTNFAATACNYAAINRVKNIVELMADYLMNQDTAANRDGSPSISMVETQAVRVLQNLMKKGNSAATAMLLREMIDTHIYGEVHHSNSILSRAIRKIIQYESVRALIVNVKGFIANDLGGLVQDIIEAGGGEFMDMKSFAKANAVLFGDTTKKIVGESLDYFRGDKDSKNSKCALIMEMFDPLQENYGEALHYNYDEGIFTKLLSGDYNFIGYKTGEWHIHLLNTYSILMFRKVFINGKEASLYDAIERYQDSNDTWRIKFKDGTQYKDENGNLKDIDSGYVDKVKREIKYVNQSCHGSMNDADKGMIHKYVLGKLLMNMRQWMTEFYSKRYRKTYYDATLKEYREGFDWTMARMVMGLAQDIFKFESNMALKWKDMNSMQRANCKRALTEVMILISLFSLSAALGEPDEKNRGWLLRMFMYQVARIKTEVTGGTPIGMITEANTLINNPIAATDAANSLLYPFVGLARGDFDKTIKSGEHKGENKYLKNMKYYWLPFYKELQRTRNFGSDDKVFNVFTKDPMQK